MAKSVVWQKRQLDDAMANKISELHRLKDNVVAALNWKIAEDKMKSAEQVIQHHHANKVDWMRDALHTMIPTDANAPKGTAKKFDLPIMVAKYVNLKVPSPTGRVELKVARESAPNLLSAIKEYVCRDFGKAPDAYQREEIAALKKEKEMFLKFCWRFCDLKDKAKSEAAFSEIDDIE
jgi:hypothetical protein